jgi:hypothetical protein
LGHPLLAGSLSSFGNFSTLQPIAHPEASNLKLPIIIGVERQSVIGFNNTVSKPLHPLQHTTHLFVAKPSS